MDEEAKQLIDADADSGIEENIGDVHIADEVVCIVASLAAQEVSGVYSMSGGLTDNINSFLGKENASKGVRIRYEGKQLRVIVYLNLEYGYCFPEVALAVQEKVKKAIEDLTGYDVQFVDVHVEGVIKPNKKISPKSEGSSTEAMEDIIKAQTMRSEIGAVGSFEQQLMAIQEYDSDESKAADEKYEKDNNPDLETKIKIAKAISEDFENEEEEYRERKYFQIGEEDSSVSAAERHRKFWEED